MKRQIARGLAMLMVTLALAAASAVVANGQSSRLSAQVPFDFVVGDKTLRAGEYHVNSLNDAGNLIVIRSDDGDRAIRSTNTAQRRGKEQRAMLVFHRYGSTYFLSQIWMAGESTGRELPETRQERAIERELKMTAANRAPAEVVEVIALAR